MSFDATFGLGETQPPRSSKDMSDHVCPPQSERTVILVILTEACVPSALDAHSRETGLCADTGNVYLKRFLYFWAEYNVLHKELLTLIKVLFRKYNDAFLLKKKKKKKNSPSFTLTLGQRKNTDPQTVSYSLFFSNSPPSLFRQSFLYSA